jgi:hypothetical protein
MEGKLQRGKEGDKGWRVTKGTSRQGTSAHHVSIVGRGVQSPSFSFCTAIHLLASLGCSFFLVVSWLRAHHIFCFFLRMIHIRGAHWARLCVFDRFGGKRREE